MLEDALVRGQVEQLATLQAQLFQAPWKVLEGHFFSVDVTVMQLKLCQARSWKRKDLMKIKASMGYRVVSTSVGNVAKTSFREILDLSGSFS